MNQFQVVRELTSEATNAKPFIIEKTNEGCWEVISHKANSDGYARMRRKGKDYKAHRFIWAYRNGKIPEGMCVLHHCDNPSCINPEHLFLGTKADNSKDMVSKDRQSKGEKNGLSKLTEREVLEIRALKGEYTLQQLGRMFGVAHSTIWKIHANQIWGVKL